MKDLMEDSKDASQGKEATRTIKKAVILDRVGEDEIYVTRKRPLIVYYKRAMELLTASECHNAIYKERLGCKRNKMLLKGEKDSRHVTIYGMGACIMTAIWLVQDLKYALGDKIQIETTTKTIEVVDECINEEREWESYQKKRNVSGVAIRVTYNN
ncbi:Ribonucleases P/MRP protein subunit Rpp200-like protein [Cryptosporidium felis]|nr:Ribonucleases P/MRP protein subunit Rpp200-like protein [Cryptosporidium felis]